MSKQVASIQEQGVISAIERIAANPDADVGKLEKMLEMQERILARNAMVSFNASLASMQAEIPAIDKNGSIKVNGVERSKYARFEDIMDVVRPILHSHGFAVSFRTDSSDSVMRVTGILMHRDGHREETTLALPFDSSGSKNSVQAIGSSTQYGKRYVLCALLNIATGGDDDDGQACGKHEASEYMALVMDNSKSIETIKTGIANNDWSTAAEAWFELDEETKRGLWKAPSKGGVFTTEERAVMQKAEFRQAYYGSEMAIK